jgi:glucose/arabinose dehydrogenase
MYTVRRSTQMLALLMGLSFLGTSAQAALHLMQIEQAIGGVNGNTTAQAIQLRMRSPFETFLSQGRIRVWDANGMNPIVVSDPTTDVPVGAVGARILFASPNFANYTDPPVVPDFTITSLIPESYLAAGSLTFENNTGTLIYWRLSWGGTSYTGPGSGTTDNDADGNFNPPWPDPLPSTSDRAIQFQGSATATSTNNADDYDLTTAAATFTNNAGNSFVISAGAVGACCDDTTGDCTENQSEDDCLNAGGRYGGDDSTCSTIDPPCLPPPVGACCNALTGTCTDGLSQINCENQGFTYGGDGSDCQTLDPPCVTFSIALEPVGTPTAVAGGSPLSSPVMATHAGDGSGRLFVADQVGQIRIIDANGDLLPTPFLVISSRMVTLDANFDERGLLGVAFHPDYANNGRFFVRYSAPRTAPPDPGEPCVGTSRGCHREVLAEYLVSIGDPDIADFNSEAILLTIDEPQFNHDGGGIAFGPDGFLYFTLGDGGGAHDGLADSPPSHGPIGNGQNWETLLGALLRIDVDSTPDIGLEYAIPINNPFVGLDGADEIWAFGLRNPFSFSFDDGPGGTGDLYLADVGQNLFEEVNIIEKGGNYGWVIREGFHCFDPFNPTNPPDTCPDTGPNGEPLLDPVMEYAQAEGGRAVIGGFVYRGSAIPILQGRYVFGDFSADFGPTGRLYYFDTTGPNAFERREFYLAPGGALLGRFLKGFGRDEDGELYACTSTVLGPTGTTGEVLKIVPPTAQVVDQDASRYVTIQPPPSPEPIGLTVTCTEGSTRYVGPPDGPGNTALLVNDPLDAAFLTSPQWGERVHVTGPGVAIVPDTEYNVHVDVGAVGSAALSAATPTATAIWGDVRGASQGTPPDGVVNFGDVSAVLDAFRGSPTAPPIHRADLTGAGSCTPNRSINFADVSTALNAFRGADDPCEGPCS